MTKIKICGLSRKQDAEYANETLPDYVGFVFAESRRRVSRGQAENIKKLLDSRIKTVGVFTNAPIGEIAALCGDRVIDLVQLHGDEDAAYIEALKKAASAPVVKAVRVKDAHQVLKAQNLPCEYLLLDTYQKNGYGGSGITFNWKLIPPLKKPYFLAGGINAANIREAISLSPYCIDISSGAETDGVKDRKKIMELTEIIRGNDYSKIS